MSKLLRVLILEDYESDALLLQYELRRGGFKLESLIVDNATDMQNALQEHQWDIILSDYNMPSFDALTAIKIAQQFGEDTPFIVVSGTVGEDAAVAVMKAGAHDFFSKDSLKRLVPAVERELGEALQRQERRTAETMAQATVDALSAHIAILDETGEIISVNQAWTDFAQENSEEDVSHGFIGMNYLKVCDDATMPAKDVANEVASGIRAVMTGFQDSWQLEYPCHSPIEKRWFTVRITRFRGDDPLRIVVAHENITARKLVEDQIKRANKLADLLRDIALASNETTDVYEIMQFTIERICAHANWDIGHAYIVPTTNDLQLESIPIWYLTNDDECTMKFKQFTDTEFDPSSNGLMRRVFETQKAEWIEDVSKSDQFVRADLAAACGLRGGYAFPIVAHQNIVGILEFFSKQPPDDLALEVVDAMTHISTQVGRVIERQQAQKALHERKNRYRALFDHSLNAVYIHDFKGNFIDANPAALNLLGYKVAEIGQLNFMDLVVPEELDKALNVLRNFVDTDYQQEATEFQIRRKDNKIIYVKTISSVIYRDDKPWAIQGIAHNITEQKRIHEEEQARRIFAEALNSTTSMLFSDDFIQEDILDTILENASKLILCDAATMIEVKSGVAHIIGAKGYSQEDREIIVKTRLDIDQTTNLQIMLQTRQPHIIADTETSDGWHIDQTNHQSMVRSNLGAPIFIGDQLFGYIILDNFAPNHFTQNHADQLALLSNQAAIAIHNAQQYEQKKQYSKRLEILHQIDKAILRADHPREIVNAVLNQMQSFTDYHSASVTVYDLEHQQQTLLAATASFPEALQQGNSYKLDYSQLISTLKEGRIYAVTDLHQKQPRSWLEEALFIAGVRSYICIPMAVGDMLIGSLNFLFQTTYEFSQAELDIAKEVAAQLAIAIENARLLEVEQRRNSELTAIHQASLQLTSTLDLETVLHTILDYAILLIDAYDAHIFLYDGEALIFGAAQWDGMRQSTPMAEPRQNGLTYTVARSGQRTAINDLSTHPEYKYDSHRGAIIGLPLTVAEQVRGVMNLGFLDTHRFDESEIRLLELLADQAAIAIHNAQLYHQIQTHAEHLEGRVIERTQQLQRAKDHVEGILNASNDSLILTDRQGKIYQTNPGFDQSFGYQPDELVGETYEAFIVPEYMEQFRTAFDNAIEHKSSHRVEVVARRHDQSLFPADALIAPIIEMENINVVCSLRDITLQKQIEVELREALEREKELNDLKTQFTSIVSHEFRTPLAVILSSSDILLKYSDRLAAEKKQSKLLQINHQVQRLTQLMDDVLMITQAESVGFEFKPRFADLLQLCETIIEELQVRNQAGIPIIFTHTGNCSDVITDEFLFTHILQNLGSNAVKYSKDSDPVLIHLECSSTRIVLKIKDHGIGIPQNHQDKLFESFQRASNVGHIQGTGIGMTIVKHAVDAHQGTIEFTSVENEGTSFVVTLPIMTT